MTKFIVEIEDARGKQVALFTDIPAQTRKEAINKVKSAIVFTATRQLPLE